MGIEELSMGMSQTKLMTDFSVGVLSMALDQIEEMGDGMVEMMNESIIEPPGVGGSLDIMV